MHDLKTILAYQLSQFYNSRCYDVRAASLVNADDLHGICHEQGIHTAPRTGDCHLMTQLYLRACEVDRSIHVPIQSPGMVKDVKNAQYCDP